MPIKAGSHPFALPVH